MLVFSLISRHFFAEAHKAYTESKVERGLLDRCLEQYDEVSSRPLDKTIESAISRSKTLSVGPAVRGIRVLFETDGDVIEAGEDATIDVHRSVSIDFNISAYCHNIDTAKYCFVYRLYDDVLEKDARAQYGNVGLRVAIFFLIYAATVFLQRNGSAGNTAGIE